MSDLLDNAVDSLQVGVGTWLHGDYETAPKHAIRHIFHAVELLLKERLSRAHPLLIYKYIDKPVTDDSLTVNLDEVLARFRNLDVRLSEEDVTLLRDLRRRRNRIEHHSFKQDPSHKHVVGKTLRFIYYFLQDHLSTTLEEVLEEGEIFNKVHEEILSFEEQLHESEKEVDRLTTPKVKDDLLSMPRRAVCPDCGNETVVIGSDRGDFCFLCREEKSMECCDTCGEYVSSDELMESGMCSQCEENRS